MTVDETQDLIDYYIELNQQDVISDLSLGILLYDLIF